MTFCLNLLLAVQTCLTDRARIPQNRLHRKASASQNLPASCELNSPDRQLQVPSLRRGMMSLRALVGAPPKCQHCVVAEGTVLWANSTPSSPPIVQNASIDVSRLTTPS